MTIIVYYSRYIVALKLHTTMAAPDFNHLLNLALEEAGFNKAKVIYFSRRLLNNVPRHISGDLAKNLMTDT